jgi:hypothetical protein
VTTPIGPEKDGGFRGLCIFFNSWVAARAIAGAGREAVKEADPAVGRVNVRLGVLECAGATVVTTTAGPDKDGAPEGFCISFRLTNTGEAPGPATRVRRKAGKEAGPAVGGDKVRPGGLAGAGAAVVITPAVVITRFWGGQWDW